MWRSIPPLLPSSMLEHEKNAVALVRRYSAGSLFQEIKQKWVRTADGGGGRERQHEKKTVRVNSCTPTLRRQAAGFGASSVKRCVHHVARMPGSCTGAALGGFCLEAHPASGPQVYRVGRPGVVAQRCGWPMERRLA